jgi:disulfide bond formation protein DsbB
VISYESIYRFIYAQIARDAMIRSRPVAAAAIAIAAIGAVTILGAGIFQYGLGLKVCPLCFEQRYAYYFAIPLAIMVVIGDQVGVSRKLLFAALVAIALGMFWNAGLGVYHSGVEWKWWAGPQECAGTLAFAERASTLWIAAKGFRSSILLFWTWPGAS